jgi:hypothetical protein
MSDLADLFHPSMPQEDEGEPKMKTFRCVEGFVSDGRDGRVVAAGTVKAAEAWGRLVGLDVLQWTDFRTHAAAHARALDFVAQPHVRFQPVDGERETLDVFWMGREKASLNMADPLVRKVLGPLFA